MPFVIDDLKTKPLTTCIDYSNQQAEEIAAAAAQFALYHV